MVLPTLPDGFDISDPDRIQSGVPMEQLDELRRTAPIWWNAQRRGIGGFDDEGFWVVTRHADVKEVSIKPEIFSTWANTAIVRFHEGMPREDIDMQRLIMLNVDPPDHTKLRRIVSRGFTPRAIKMLSEALAARAEQIVADAAAHGHGDFVTEVAAELPLQAIAELIGVPQEDRAKIFGWSNQMIAYDDPEYEIDPVVASAELINYAMGLSESRVSEPRDDIVTKLVNADVDGRGLTSDEFAFFVLLLAVAGNETTRNAISHGMLGFFQFPDQWERYRAERPATAADEIVRWATPVMTFQRTALADAVLAGTEIKAGQRVGLCYSAANFDPEVFDHPERFDVGRDPNPHVGFGGGGPHYCLGANLAKVEINLMFNAIADQMPRIVQAGPARRLRSAWINGIKELPRQVRLTVEIVEGRFAGRVAFVTGAASGIGRATAQRLGAEGAAVACLDLAADGAAKTAAGIVETGGTAEAFVCDVSDPVSVREAVDRAVAAVGEPGICCNVAGIGRFYHTADMPLEAWQRILAVNLTGTFLVSQAVLPYLLDRDGVIVNTASTSSTQAQPYQAAYAASKGGVLMFTKALALEYLDRRLRVNAIAPGGVQTPVLDEFANVPEGVDVRRLMRYVSPLGFCQPEDIASLFAYVASPEAHYMTGSVVTMDGGMTV